MTTAAARPGGPTRLASTSTTVNAGQLRIRTSATVGKPVWEDLVGHFEFGVTATQPYRLQFDASADVSRDVRVSVSRADTPFTSAVDQTVALTSTTRRFTFDFTSPFGDPKAVLLFHFGNHAASTVRLDNISLTPLATPTGCGCRSATRAPWTTSWRRRCTRPSTRRRSTC
ncbi:carbohydrate binding domain-containing protein [Micromonospora sp. NPDC049275]|uniref:carbohydrate binding domain-containing protein n=1 Tax=Micromonospora sp. NPDC049275 TaxID=3364268 RepID=UPI0037151F22